MIASAPVHTGLELRSARAEALAAGAPAAREPLLFVATLFRAQAALAKGIESLVLTGRFDDDADRLLPLTESLFRIVADRGPDLLIEQSLARLDDDASTARTRLQLYWNGEVSAREDYLSRAVLRPYAEVLRAQGATLERLHHPRHCPFCGGAAMISTRRTPPDSEAGIRLLHCALCALEWNINRICCPACGEDDPYKLPIYSSDPHPTVRIEACETCRRYVKSIDLSQDARPIAEVDDLLSLSMDLWAMEEGLVRIEPGLAGV
ncbi:MAG TPA: formate dehydrogenase accessory protein FdhE [Thermoanaerobaculia bacterium]|jgi:formate dehydrogenase maturation protein FdhE|nr:formate dehydrogenase accessory protein FdhE [Thermoanaerobaculia bacterium]